MKVKPLPAPRYELNAYELRALKALGSCTFLPGSAPKRFVMQSKGATEMTEKQRDWLRVLTYRYRRQLKMTDDEATLFVSSMFDGQMMMDRLDAAEARLAEQLMRSTFRAVDVDDIRFTLSITMRLKDWTILASQLSNQWPAWELSSQITQMVVAAQKMWTADDAKPQLE